GTDESELSPIYPDLGCKSLLIRAHRAFARGGGPFRVHHDRAFLEGQYLIALGSRSFPEPGIDKLADHLGAALVARDAGGNGREQTCITPYTAVLRAHR